jgi:excinuclease ABC subunit A
MDKIVVRGAREHNLKNVTVEIPRDKMVVITGISGSGKSSLAFDTIYAEGQRRYVESLSAYARQFLGQMKKPDVDQIEGLSPAISIDQKGMSHNPRSTVGTVTEIYDYLRLLYARIGIPHCPNCGRPIEQQSAQQIVEAITDMPVDSRIMVLAPLVKGRKGHHQPVFQEIQRAGFVRARVDGEIRDMDEEIELDRYKMHNIEVVVDRLILRQAETAQEREELYARLTDSVETALNLGEGFMIVNDVTEDEPRDILFSEYLACPECGLSFPEIEPRTFSFNGPLVGRGRDQALEFLPRRGRLLCSPAQDGRPGVGDPVARPDPQPARGKDRRAALWRRRSSPAGPVPLPRRARSPTHDPL